MNLHKRHTGVSTLMLTQARMPINTHTQTQTRCTDKGPRTTFAFTHHGLPTVDRLCDLGHMTAFQCVTPVVHSLVVYVLVLNTYRPVCRSLPELWYTDRKPPFCPQRGGVKGPLSPKVLTKPESEDAREVALIVTTVLHNAL